MLEKRGKHRPSCDSCKMPMLLAESFEAYSLAREAVVLCASEAGIRAGGIDLVLRSHGFVEGTDEYRKYVRYISAYVVVFLGEVRSAMADKTKQAPIGLGKDKGRKITVASVNKSIISGKIPRVPVSSVRRSY